jgi:hypothetical protein
MQDEDPYKYVPAQEEMAEAVDWLLTKEGHAWIGDQCPAAIKNSSMSLGLSGQPWISVKDPEKYEFVWFPPCHRTRSAEKRIAIAAWINGGRWIEYLPMDSEGWLDIEELRVKVKEFYQPLSLLQEAA